MSKRQNDIERLIERLDYRIAAFQEVREELLAGLHQAAKPAKKPRTLAAVAVADGQK